MVAVLGVEPRKPSFWEKDVCQITSDGYGRHREIRTRTEQGLGLLPLPLGYVPMVAHLGFEPRLAGF